MRKSIIRNLAQITIFISLFSCTPSNKQTVDTEIEIIKIGIDKKEQYLNMSEIIDSIQYIHLETTPDNLIGDVSKLIPLKDRMLVVDQINAQSIFFFDNNGKYISKIANRGMGPEEYVSIKSVTVDEEGNRVFIYDSDQHKILIYSMQGKYIESITPDFFLREIEYVGGDVLSCYGDYYSGDDRMVKNGKTPLIILYNLKNKKKIGHCYESTSITSSERVLPYQTLAGYSNTNAVFFYPLSEYIYEVNSQDVKETYQIIFSEKNDELKSDYIIRLQNEKIEPVQLMPGGNARENFYSLSGTMKGDGFLFVGYLNRKEEVNGMGVYYLKSKKFVNGYSAERFPIRNDIDSGFPLIPGAILNNKVYTIIDTGYLEQLNTTSPVLKQYQQTMTSDDNPVIMISTMKIK